MGALLFGFTYAAQGVGGGLALLCLFLADLGLRDMRQRRQSVLRNYPVISHIRFLLEFIRPEVRQYLIESDHEASPFSRQQRSLVYQRAKGDADKRPFGTQLDVHATGYEWLCQRLRHRAQHGAGRRLVQRGARLHVRAGLHPGAGLPHGPLPRTGVTTQDRKRQPALVVPTKMERVWRFHQNTLEALKELVQAAGLDDPGQIRAAHIVRRGTDHQVRLLANQLAFAKAGALQAAVEGHADWPHAVFELYWPRTVTRASPPASPRSLSSAGRCR